MLVAERRPSSNYSLVNLVDDSPLLTPAAGNDEGDDFQL